MRAAPWIVLTALWLALFGRVLLGDETLFVRDVMHVYLPVAAIKLEAWRAGAWPLWNPRLFAGIPFAADFVSQAWYPPSLLLLLPPLSRGFGLFTAAHFLWAAFGAFALARVLGRSRPAATLSAVVFGFGGPLVSNHLAVHFLCSYAWAGWALAAWCRWLERRDARSAALTALSMAMMLLAGDPQTVLVIGALQLALIPTLSPKQTRLAALGVQGRIAALALLISAPLWLPGLELVRLSDRSSAIDLDSSQWWSLHPLRLFEWLVPLPFGEIFPDSNFFGERLVAPLNFFYLPSIYLGVLTPVLAVLGLRAMERNFRRFMIASLAALLLLTLGRWGGLWSILYAALPGWSLFRFPERLTVFVALLLALAAAFGADEITAQPLHRRTRWAFGALAGAVGLTAGVCFGLNEALNDALSLWPGRPIAADALSSVAKNALRSAAVLLAALLLLSRLHRGRLLALSLVAVVDVASFAPRLFWLAPNELILETPPALALAPEPGFRLVRDSSLDARENVDLSSAVHPLLQQAALERDSCMGDFCALHQRDYWVAYLSLVPSVFREAWKRLPLDVNYDLWAVSRIIAPHRFHGTVLRREAYRPEGAVGPAALFRNPDPLPRYRLTGSTPVGSQAEALEWMRNNLGRLRKVTPVENGPTIAPPPDGEVETLESGSPNRVEVKTKSSGPALLLMADAWWSGWTAEVDGLEVPLLRANHAQRGVALEAGEHRVSLRYWPPALTPALVLLALGLAIAFVWLSRKPEPAAPPRA